MIQLTPARQLLVLGQSANDRGGTPDTPRSHARYVAAGPHIFDLTLRCIEYPVLEIHTKYRIMGRTRTSR